MRRLYITSGLFLCILAYNSCTEEDDLLLSSLETCETTTDFYAKMFLDQELLCWNDAYPFQIGSGGTGNCGEGYEYVENPFISLGINLVAYNTNEAEYSTSDKVINIDVRFACEDFSTQEKFYNLITLDQYFFAENQEEFGKFIVEYHKDGEVYSSLLANNSQFQVKIEEIVRVKPQFFDEPNGNNGVPASMDVKLSFSCQLSNEFNETIGIRNAEVRGRIYRQSPWGYYWEDWGKRWDE